MKTCLLGLFIDNNFMHVNNPAKKSGRIVSTPIKCLNKFKYIILDNMN